jgi:hypothetical protein
MMPRVLRSDFELYVTLAVVALGDDAYGVTISGRIAG